MMNMKPQEFLETGLLEQYVMGLLSTDEAEQVAHYIKQNPTVKIQFDDLQKSIANLAESHSIIPPTHIKGNVLKSITNNSSNTISASESWKKYLTYTAAIFFGITTFLAYNKIQNLNKKIASHQKEYKDLEANCQQSQQKAEQQNKIFAFYKDPNTQSIQLTGNKKAPNFNMVAHYNKSKERLALQVTTNTPISKDKMLCLWGDKDGKMILITKLDAMEIDQLVTFDNAMTSLNITVEERIESIDHPDVSQLIASVVI